MQIGLETGQTLVQSFIAGAGVRRRRVIAGREAQCPKQVASRVVLQHHHSYRVLDRAEERRRNLAALAGGLLHTCDVRKENLLFFEHVRDQVLLESIECLLRFEQRRMVFSMARADFVEELLQAIKLMSGEYVVSINDVFGERRERLLPPIALGAAL